MEVFLESSISMRIWGVHESSEYEIFQKEKTRCNAKNYCWEPRALKVGTTGSQVSGATMSTAATQLRHMSPEQKAFSIFCHRGAPEPSGRGFGVTKPKSFTPFWYLALLYSRDLQKIEIPTFTLAPGRPALPRQRTEWSSTLTAVVLKGPRERRSERQESNRR